MCHLLPEEHGCPYYKEMGTVNIVWQWLWLSWTYRLFLILDVRGLNPVISKIYSLCVTVNVENTYVKTKVAWNGPFKNVKIVVSFEGDSVAIALDCSRMLFLMAVTQKWGICVDCEDLLDVDVACWNCKVELSLDSWSPHVLAWINKFQYIRNQWQHISLSGQSN